VAALTVVLLLAGVAGAVIRPWGLPAWLAPVVATGVDLAAGSITPSGAGRALEPLAAPIGFLLAAVPLAILLDQLGFFSSLADVLARRGRGAGALWVVGALVTTVLNLDAGVVLLTPLYVRFARATGRDPFALGAQPVLLACLASSALPVSNLTNLIAQSETGASTAGFLSHLALPSLAACVVGWFCYRRMMGDRLSTSGVADPGAADAAGGGGGSRGWGAGGGSGGGGVLTRRAVDAQRALTVGGTIVVLVLIGFTVGHSFGVEPWMVALGADVVLIALRREVPLRYVPVGTALVALALGVLAAAAVVHLPVHRLIGGDGIAAMARTAGVTAAAANVINNLPALLVTVPSVGGRAVPNLWAVLIGVNMGPVVLVTGSLASLLWLDALGRLGVEARAREFTRIGIRVGLPAAVTGLGVLLALRAAGLGG
jgi:arsenical pump membrane protein